MTSSFKIGVSARLGAGSVHTTTSVDAVNHAFIQLSTRHPELNITLVWADDMASAAGASKASDELVRQGVDVVVGHFASSAAAVAATIYDQHKIPLLLPAATAGYLIEDYVSTYRLCPSDRALAAGLYHAIQEKGEGARIIVVSDTSVHGDSMREELLILEPSHFVKTDNGLDGLAVSPADSAVVFCGMYQNAVDFVQRNSQCGLPIYFSDDALHDDLLVDTADCPLEISVVGFKRQGQLSPVQMIYYTETFTAMEVAYSLLMENPIAQNRDAILKAKTHDTMMGPLHFNDARENPFADAQCWDIVNQKFLPSKHKKNNQQVGIPNEC